MAKRKFFKTVIRLEVLTEDAPLEVDDLGSIAYEISQGNHSAQYDVKLSRRISAKRAAEILMEHGSDPEFFDLTEEGKDLREGFEEAS